MMSGCIFFGYLEPVVVRVAQHPTVEAGAAKVAKAFGGTWPGQEEANGTRTVLATVVHRRRELMVDREGRVLATTIFRKSLLLGLGTCSRGNCRGGKDPRKR